MNPVVINNIIKALIENQQWPNITFKSGSLFAAAVDAISCNSARDPGVTDTEAAAKWLEKMYADESPILANLCDEAAMVIADGLTNARETIKTINAQVTEFVNTIEDRVGRQIVLDPKLVQPEAGSNEFKFARMDFSPLNKIAGTTAQMAVMDETIVGAKGATATNYIGIMEKYANMKVKGEPIDIELSDDTRQTIITELNSANPQFNTDTIKMALALVTRAGVVNEFIRNCQIAMEPKTDYTDEIVEALAIIDIYGNLIPKLHDKLLELGRIDATNAVNLDKVMAVLEMYFYFVQYHRNGLYQDTVLFKNQLRNPDLDAKMTAAGLTDLDVTKHLGIVWKGNILQAVGITMASLQNAKERVDVEYANGVAADELYRKHTLAGIYRTITVKVMCDYFNTLNIDVYEYVLAKMDGLAVGGEPLEDLLFNILVTYQYNNNPVLTAIYRKLGAAYIQAVKNNPQVDESMINDVNVDIMLEVAVEVIAKKMLA
jgi:hypothetical protein